MTTAINSTLIIIILTITTVVVIIMDICRYIFDLYQSQTSKIPFWKNISMNRNTVCTRSKRVICMMRIRGHWVKLTPSWDQWLGGRWWRPAPRVRSAPQRTAAASARGRRGAARPPGTGCSWLTHSLLDTHIQHTHTHTHTHTHRCSLTDTSTTTQTYSWYPIHSCICN